MSWRKMLATLVLAEALCLSAGASVSEIRRNFFEQTANLPATAIMAGPTGEDGSYLIAIYESSTSAAIPTLRWIDENGVAQAQTASCASLCQLLAFIRVQAGTQATVETSGYSGSAPYSLYVSGLGFWRTGVQRQAGLGEATGIAVTDKSIYTATASVSALLVAYVESAQGQQSVTWWDEDGQRTAAIPFGSPLVTPIRVAGGTSVRVFDITQTKTHVWYGLILFGAPASGAGPFTDYEYNMLNWTNASYPNFETVFTNGTSPATVLVATNFAEQSNSGSVEEGFNLVGVGTVNPSPCPNGLLAGTAGSPVGCVLPFTVLPNTALQVRTINGKGSPWGHSPTYSAEVDVLQF
jgi:hypothetical protein